MKLRYLHEENKFKQFTQLWGMAGITLYEIARQIGVPKRTVEKWARYIKQKEREQGRQGQFGFMTEPEPKQGLDMPNKYDIRLLKNGRLHPEFRHPWGFLAYPHEAEARAERIVDRLRQSGIDFDDYKLEQPKKKHTWKRVPNQYPQ